LTTVDNINNKHQANMKPNDSIIERIKKCLALASGLNATQAEMEVAMGKAKEIAMHHGIDLSSVSMEPDEVKKSIKVGTDDTLKTRSEYVQPYHKWIFHILQECFDVRVIYHKASLYSGAKITKIMLIGETVDMLIAREIFSYLEKLFPRTLSTAVREKRLTYCAADTNGCYSGLCQGIIRNNRREEEKLNKDDASKWALVVKSKEEVIDEKVKELYPELRTTRRSSSQFSDEGLGYGYAKGSQIRLNQIGCGTSAPALRS